MTENEGEGGRERKKRGRENWNFIKVSEPEEYIASNELNIHMHES